MVQSTFGTVFNHTQHAVALHLSSLGDLLPLVSISEWLEATPSAFPSKCVSFSSQRLLFSAKLATSHHETLLFTINLNNHSPDKDRFAHLE